MATKYYQTWDDMGFSSGPANPSSQLNQMSTPNQSKSSLKVAQKFKEYLEKLDAWEDWVGELKFLNDYLTPDAKDKHARYIQTLMDKGEYAKALNESFLRSVSLKGTNYWDNIMADVITLEITDQKRAELASKPQSALENVLAPYKDMFDEACDILKRKKGISRITEADYEDLEKEFLRIAEQQNVKLPW